MGNQAVSPLNNWDLDAYARMTGLSTSQIQQLQTTFNQQATNGRMTIDQFKRVYASISGLTWNFDADAERIFLLLDKDGNGVLTFDEFLMGYLMLQRGTNPTQRWTYALNNYSLSRPGYLSQQEAQMLLGNMQQFYNFPMQESYFNTAWSTVGGAQAGYVPINTFVEAVIPLIPQNYIW